MKLDLSPQEATFLAAMMRRSLDELRREIYRTSNSLYKRGLKEDERLLERILDQLRPEIPPPTQIHY
jgi:hypothetical protein